MYFPGVYFFIHTVEGCRGDQVKRSYQFSLFILCSLSSFGSVCFIHLSDSILWNQDASSELQINWGLHLFLLFYIIGGVNPENKKYNLSYSIPLCSVLLTVLIHDDYIVSQLTSVELSNFSDAEWCQWRFIWDSFEVLHLAAFVSPK